MLFNVHLRGKYIYCAYMFTVDILYTMYNLYCTIYIYTAYIKYIFI